MEDKINHPKHYNNSLARCECGRRIECIDVTRHMNFSIGNIIKYLWRYKDKNGNEDLKKAQWYLNDLVKQMDTKVVAVTPGWEHTEPHVVFNNGCKL